MVFRTFNQGGGGAHPGSYDDRCAEMLQLVDNGDWHDNLPVEAWKQFNLANQYEGVKWPRVRDDDHCPRN